MGLCVLCVVRVCVGENYSNQFIFRNFPTEFHGSHADCLAGDQAPCLRSEGGGMTSVASAGRDTGTFNWRRVEWRLRGITGNVLSLHHRHHNQAPITTVASSATTPATARQLMWENISEHFKILLRFFSSLINIQTVPVGRARLGQ